MRDTTAVESAGFDDAPVAVGLAVLLAGALAEQEREKESREKNFEGGSAKVGLACRVFIATDDFRDFEERTIGFRSILQSLFDGE